VRPYIEEQRCDGCGECIEICPYDVFSRNNGEMIIVLTPEDCIECTSFIDQCSKNAIYMDD
jgi:NAD-dependent dihydropyrimidine dehydrogenase PreA subunit